jgi:hypothetical protein
MMIPLTEQRFRDAQGNQFLADGITIRCHGTSKSQLRKWREEHDDYVTPSEELWPECQCSRAAVTGMFACKWHGGITRAKEPKTLFDTLPLELGQKFKKLVENPSYISRRDEIALLQARNWELMEKLDDEPAEEAWGYVVEALVELKKGNDQKASYCLDKALNSGKETRKIWEEVRANSTVLKDLTNTQIRTAKELQSMATTEQVSALMQGILKAIAQGADTYIDDTNQRIAFLQFLSGRVAGLTSYSALPVINRPDRSSDQDDRDSE